MTDHAAGEAPQPPEAAVVRRWKFADFAAIDGVPCPCGTARRAFHGVPEFPGTIHVTQIEEDAKQHYHRTLTETYFFLECLPDAKMWLDGEIIDVRPGQCIVIPPGVRHRAIGRMKVLIVVLPEFDPTDEWFD
ncbi:MAG: cupin domain-containing protein [Planctomycetaceae bacterium]|nr:cupin domain-containing protein [Planctomycetaceae bacterium]